MTSSIFTPLRATGWFSTMNTMGFCHPAITAPGLEKTREFVYPMHASERQEFMQKIADLRSPVCLQEKVIFPWQRLVLDFDKVQLVDGSLKTTVAGLVKMVQRQAKSFWMYGGDSTVEHALFAVVTICTEDDLRIGIRLHFPNLVVSSAKVSGFLEFLPGVDTGPVHHMRLPYTRKSYDKMRVYRCYGWMHEGAELLLHPIEVNMGWNCMKAFQLIGDVCGGDPFSMNINSCQLFNILAGIPSGSLRWHFRGVQDKCFVFSRNVTILRSFVDGGYALRYTCTGPGGYMFYFLYAGQEFRFMIETNVPHDGDQIGMQRYYDVRNQLYLDYEREFELKQSCMMIPENLSMQMTPDLSLPSDAVYGGKDDFVNAEWHYDGVFPYLSTAPTQSHERLIYHGPMWMFRRPVFVELSEEWTMDHLFDVEDAMRSLFQFGDGQMWTMMPDRTVFFSVLLSYSEKIVLSNAFKYVRGLNWKRLGKCDSPIVTFFCRVRSEQMLEFLKGPFRTIRALREMKCKSAHSFAYKMSTSNDKIEWDLEAVAKACKLPSMCAVNMDECEFDSVRALIKDKHIYCRKTKIYVNGKVCGVSLNKQIVRNVVPRYLDRTTSTLAEVFFGSFGFTRAVPLKGSIMCDSYTEVDEEVILSHIDMERVYYTGERFSVSDVREQFHRPVEPNIQHVLILEGGCGAGKTSAVFDTLTEKVRRPGALDTIFRAREDLIVYVSPRRAVLSNVYTEFVAKGLPSWHYEQGRLENSTKWNALCVTSHSVVKVVTYVRNWLTLEHRGRLVVILDEWACMQWDSATDFLSLGKCTDLLWLLGKSDVLVAMDADLRVQFRLLLELMDYFRGMYPLAVRPIMKVFYHTAAVQLAKEQEREIVYFYHPSRSVANGKCFMYAESFMRRPAGVIAMFFASKAELLTFAAWAKEDQSMSEAFIEYHADNKPLIDLRGKRVLCYTTAMGLGVDISDVQFDAVFLIGVGHMNHVTVADIMQASNRVRNFGELIMCGTTLIDPFSVTMSLGDSWDLMSMSEDEMIAALFVEPSLVTLADLTQTHAGTDRTVANVGTPLVRSKLLKLLSDRILACEPARLALIVGRFALAGYTSLVIRNCRDVTKEDVEYINKLQLNLEVSRFMRVSDKSFEDTLTPALIVRNSYDRDKLYPVWCPCLASFLENLHSFCARVWTHMDNMYLLTKLRGAMRFEHVKLLVQRQIERVEAEKSWKRGNVSALEDGREIFDDEYPLFLEQYCVHWETYLYMLLRSRKTDMFGRIIADADTYELCIDLRKLKEEQELWLAPLSDNVTYIKSLYNVQSTEAAINKVSRALFSCAMPEHGVVIREEDDFARVLSLWGLYRKSGVREEDLSAINDPWPGIHEEYSSGKAKDDSLGFLSLSQSKRKKYNKYNV